MKIYQLTFCSLEDDPFGDGQIVPATSVEELADLIEQHVILGDFCDISITEDNVSTGACQVYRLENPFVECIESWGSAEGLEAELNDCRA